MWTRKDLKMKAKASFKANYWRCVFVALILVAIIGASASYGASQGYKAGNSEVTVVAEMSEHTRNVLLGIILALVSFVGLITVLFNILVRMPLEVGCQHFFVENSKEKVDLGKLKRGFTPYYWRTVGAMLLRGIYICLWTLLFVIPGIIKSYSYAMVPYIIADNENISPKEAITLSRKMMNGNKWKLFVLQLSFFGWGLLSVITLGLLGVFYVQPYFFSTNAEFYLAIKEEYETKA